MLIDQQLCPEERLKSLIGYSSRVEIDPSVSARLYYRSGLSMFKQFSIYYSEGSWENALCIYLKYEKLFFDKIKKHPEYDKISVNVKSINAANFRILKPKAEHAKRELLKEYRRNYVSYVEEIKDIQMEHACDTSVIASDKIKLPQNTTKLAPSSPNFSLKNEKSMIESATSLQNSAFYSDVSFQTSRKITKQAKDGEDQRLVDTRCAWKKGSAEASTKNTSTTSNMKRTSQKIV